MSQLSLFVKWKQWMVSCNMTERKLKHKHRMSRKIKFDSLILFTFFFSSQLQCYWSNMTLLSFTTYFFTIIHFVQTCKIVLTKFHISLNQKKKNNSRSSHKLSPYNEDLAAVWVTYIFGKIMNRVNRITKMRKKKQNVELPVKTKNLTPNS